MLDKSVNLFEELDNISKVHWLNRDDIDTIMIDFATQISLSLRIERINVWLFDDYREGIVSIGEYDKRTGEFKKDSVLLKKDYPAYFNALANNKIILAENIHTNRATREFDETYSKPLGVESLMDVPLRIAGELIGVICFEKVGTPRRFTLREQSFAMSVSMVLASTLEARHRRAVQYKLDKLLAEKDLLIKEINHRVKNNFAILISLLRLSKQKGKTADPTLLLGEFEERIMSMTKIHDLLCQTNNYTIVNLSDYLKELVKGFKNAHLETKDSVIEHLDIVNCYLPTKEGIHMGLIITEIFLNSIKYVFLKN
ncbi:MAG: sensor histidine kinase, partial [Bacteroidia bacterium]